MRTAKFNFNTAIHAIAVFILIILIYIPTLTISQVPDTSKYGVKIAYPSDGQKVPVGELTIFGAATYNATTTDCTVYVDRNDSEPMRKVMPAGPDYTELGRTNNDYSTWIFTYTNKYQIITEGTNELTAKLSCDVGPFNSTKYDSVNIIGVS